MGMINNTLNHLRAYAFGESCTDITVMVSMRLT